MERRINRNWRNAVTNVTLLVLNLMFVQFALAQLPPWVNKLKELKVAESTVQEVDQAFGPLELIRSTNYAQLRKSGWGRIDEYKTSYGTLEVTFSTGRCTDSNTKSGYDIEAGKVVQLIFEPFRRKSPSALGFNLRMFKEEPVKDVPSSLMFFDRDNGLILSVYKGKVNSIEIGLSKKQHSLMDCKNLPASD